MDDSGCVLKCDYAIKPLNGENSHNIFGVPYFQTINLKPESFLLAKNCGSFEKKKHQALNVVVNYLGATWIVVYKLWVQSHPANSNGD